MTYLSREFTRWCAVALIAAMVSPAAPAHALLRKAWVSGKGANASSCGSIASPCQTLQYVHNAIIASGGIIALLDSAETGALTITKSLTIVNDGAGMLLVVAGAAGQNGVTVNAGAAGVVVLRGLTINGLGTGSTGISLLGAKSLSVEKCSVRNFAASGVALAPTNNNARIVVSDTTVENNGGHGIYVQPPGGVQSANVDLSRVDVHSNALKGIGVYANLTTSATVSVNVTDTTSSHNGQDGFYALGSGTSGAFLSITRSKSFANGAYGLFAAESSRVSVSETAMQGNASGAWAGVQPAVLKSYVDNLTEEQTGAGFGATNIGKR